MTSLTGALGAACISSGGQVGPVRVRDPAILERIYRLRVAAWRARVPAFPAIETWSDPHDDLADAMHWAIFDGDRPVAAARLTIHTKLTELPSAEIYAGALPIDLAAPIAALGRLVVMPRYAGGGLSRLLDAARIDAARTAACCGIVGATVAGTSRVAALEALGFESLGQSRAYETGPLAAMESGTLIRPEIMLLRFGARR